MIYWDFLGDRYDTYEAAYDACCNEEPDGYEVFRELSRYSSFKILEAIRTGNAHLYEEIIDSLNEERAGYIIGIEVTEEEDEEEET